jgi:hypothetical protein
MQMILWPAVITLAITLLRLVGELQGWNPAIFNRAAGGGGSPLGISWLPFLFGPWFAWRLAKAGQGAVGWKAAGHALLGLLIAILPLVALGALGASQTIMLLVSAVTTLSAVAFVRRGWPELWRVLMGYALAARVPVALVMLVAIFGNWGTHYDVLPPNPSPQLAAMGPLQKWLFIGLLPQMTLWIAQTVLIGMLIGGIVVALGKPKPAA